MPRLLMIEDDARLAGMVADYLAAAGFAVDHAPDATRGLEALAVPPQALPDLVILDLMLPDLDGLEVCRRLRALPGEAGRVPVLMLTARGDEADRIVGLEMGADDYLPKTFSTRELLARLRAVTRRTVRSQNPESGSDEEFVVGPLRVRPASRTAILGDVPLTLTPVEYDLLVSLAKARGRVKTREALLDEIRERDYDVFDRSIDVHISALRKKLNDDPKHPRFIRTLRSAGYMMVDPEDPE
jgi:DNA-binding response OmpR family regulator